MKIQIIDGSTSITVENNESLTSNKGRKILDILFSTVDPTSRINVVPKKVDIDSDTSVDFPIDPSEFSSWLNKDAPTSTVEKLSDFIGFDLTRAVNMNKLITEAPQFASKLGFNRYVIAASWLYSQGWMNFLPSDVSLRSYYSRGLRLS